MAASPEAVKVPETSDTHPSLHPPSSSVPHPTQESPSRTTAAQPELASPDQATPVPPPPTEESKLALPEARRPPPPPIDGAGPPPPAPEAAPATSPALEAASLDKPAPPSPCPADEAFEVSPEVAASAPSPPPSPSPQIVEVSPEDAPKPPSPPRTPLATTTGASTAPSIAVAVAMAAEEVACPPPAPESMDAEWHAAPAPLTPPVENGGEPEELLLRKQSRSPSPEITPSVCENSEPAQPSPLPVCPPTECTDAWPEAAVDEVVAGTLEKTAQSPPASEAMYEDTDSTPGVLAALESGPEGMLPQQQPRSCPEMAPPQCENSESTPLLKLSPPAESTYACPNTAANEIAVVASEQAVPPASETTDGEGALEIGAERSLEKPVMTSTSSRMEAEPCSLEMAPPGFEDFKSQLLPLSPSTPLTESTNTLVEAAAANAADTIPDAKAESLSTLEAMEVEMSTSPSLLPPMKSGAEGQVQQSLPGSCSPTTKAEPCSPDMPPPGFENCKSSWLPLPSLPPLAETTYASLDVSATKAVAVTFLEKACSVPALGATNVETDTEQSLLAPLENGAGSSLQGRLPKQFSPKIQATSCSLDTALTDENLELTQRQLISSPRVQTACILQDSAAKGAVYVKSEETPQPSPALEARDLDMDAAPALAPPSESEGVKSLSREPPLLPSHVVQHTVCSRGMVPSGSEIVESSQLLPKAEVLPLEQTSGALVAAGSKETEIVEELCPIPVPGATEVANGSILPPALENGGEGPLPNIEPHVSSPRVNAAASASEIAPASFENSELSRRTFPCVTETVDPSAHAPATMLVTVKSEKTSQPVSPLQATDIDKESATLMQLPLKSEEKSLSQSEQHPSPPSVKDAACSPDIVPPGFENVDSLDQLPAPPPLTSKFEMGQMVCGCCRQLLAYPRGSVHVQCYGCWTVNLVLEEYQVGKVYCGQCATLLMYPFGAPAVRCSNCLFITEIGERNVRPRISLERVASPKQEITNQS